MVYKRKAQVLFVSSGDSSRALLAAAFANSLGSCYIHARAVVLVPKALAPALLSALRELGLDGIDQTLYPLDADNLAWADLVVALDETAALACPTLLASVQRRCYRFAVPENLQSLRQVSDAIRQRVAGMVGGMVMLASDVSPNPVLDDGIDRERSSGCAK